MNWKLACLALSLVAATTLAAPVVEVAESRSASAAPVVEVAESRSAPAAPVAPVEPSPSAPVVSNPVDSATVADSSLAATLVPEETNDRLLALHKHKVALRRFWESGDWDPELDAELIDALTMMLQLLELRGDSELKEEDKAVIAMEIIFRFKSRWNPVTESRPMLRNLELENEDVVPLNNREHFFRDSSADSGEECESEDEASCFRNYM